LLSKLLFIQIYNFITIKFIKGYQQICNALGNLPNSVNEYLKVASSGFLNCPEDVFLKTLKVLIEFIENPQNETIEIEFNIHPALNCVL
jgi:hypothetical protein